MVIRNRLIALAYRLIAFAGILITLIFVFRAPIEAYVPLSYFGVLVALLVLALLFFEIVFNAVDLRHGMNGIPAGASMRIALPIVCFSSEASLGFLISSFFRGAPPALEIVFYSGLLVFPALDWILFDEKGTVPFYVAFTSQIVPIFYGIFSIFRAIIWPDSPLLGGAMYPYPFLDPHSSWFWPGCIIVFASFLAFSVLIVFLNNLLSSKYRKAKIR